MMFQETLDSVANQLDDAQKTTTFAITQLASIGSLTWNSSAGQAFYQRVVELISRLESLKAEMSNAENYLSVAIHEIQDLEAQIMNQRMAS